MSRISREESLLLESVTKEVRPDYLRSNFMDVVENPFGEAWIDPLSDGITQLLRQSSKNYELYRHEGYPLTSVSYKFFGTTSLWYVILYINGYLHPDEISLGEELKIPDLQIAQTLIAKQRAVSRTGEVVVV